MAAADSDQYSIFGDALLFIQQTSLCARHRTRQGEAQNGSVEVRKHTGLGETARSSGHLGCRRHQKQNEVAEGLRGLGFQCPV